VFTRSEASPESLGVAPDMACPISAGIAAPKPTPISKMTGRMSTA
jgi:hypothetical protein